MIYFYDTMNLNPSAGGVIQASENLLDGLVSVSFHNVRKVSEIAHKTPNYINKFCGRFGVEEYISWKLANESNASAIFPNYYLPYLLSQKIAKRSVFVVHDLQFLHLPQYFSRLKRIWLDTQLKRLFDSAGAISFISHASMADFINAYGNRERLFVSHNPIAKRYFSEKATIKVRPTKDSYLLASYHFYPHKNFIGSLRLFSSLLAAGYEGSLFVTGSGKEKVEAIIREHAPHLENRVSHLGMLSSDELLATQIRADAFISLSEFEGFNLPAAECAVLGKGLILSDIPVHRELFSNYAYFVNSDFDADAAVAYLKNTKKNSCWQFFDSCSPSSAARRTLNILDQLT